MVKNIGFTMLCSIKKYWLLLILSGLFISPVKNVSANSNWWPEGATSVNGLPVANIKRVLNQGFSAISHKYITPVKAGELAVNALKGLSTIDPAIKVHTDGNRIMVRYSGLMLRSFSSPEADDAKGWSELSIATMLALKSKSSGLRTAGEEKIYKAMFDACLKELDDFSKYSGVENARENRASRTGFGGLGIRYRRVENAISVSEVIPETPAAYAGIEIGDKITHIDKEPISEMSRRDIIENLRGPIGSKVKITYLRGAGTRSVVPVKTSVVRELIVPSSVDYSFTKGILNMQIHIFNQKTANSVLRAVREIQRNKEEKLEGIIIDLRGNPGGLLDQAIRVSDLFLDRGAIVSTRGRHPDSMQSYEATSGDITNGTPIMIVIDGKSASAAEIVSAALQDQGRAVVVGTSSYGKGTVQTVVRLPNGGEIRLTWSRFHAPSGYTLNKLGVLPVLCTSSMKTLEPVRDVISSLRAGDMSVMATQELWRSASPDDEKLRKQLRNTCPSETHIDTDFDISIANMLLHNSEDYRRALSITLQDAALR